ncbi:zinc-binding dehydrogenase [Actinomadura sp. NPDC049753]|uniref:zinc-binding dehydrogenase n=1 Tax=Actinomadura sp. NPDC049753 TaxID=3154739 RepID=UPI0034220BB7
MRATQQSAWGGTGTMALVEVAEPVPVFGEVLVRVMAAGVNPVDVYTRRGRAYNQVLDLPFVNGWDVAGEEMFGGRAGLEALECLRPGGVLVSGQAAWTPGLHERAADLGVRAVDYLVDPDGAGLGALAELVADGRLKVHVDAVFPLAEAAAAHDRVAEGHTTGKVVLAVGEHA